MFTPTATAGPSPSAGSYRPDVDGLRAVAVLAVLGFHAFPRWVPGGFVGVDVFLVISGYLITGIIVGALRAGSFQFRHFYARRIRRIFPALLVVSVASLGFGWFALLPDEYAQLGKHVFAGTAFVSNFALWRESGYFDPGVDVKPLQHLWSLGVEEQFYLGWPLLVALTWRRHRLLPAISWITVLSFLVCIAMLRTDASAAFYFPIGRLWELSMGALLTVFTTPGPSALDPLKRSYAWFGSGLRANHISMGGALLLGLSMIALDDGAVFPGWSALGPAIGAMLIIAAGPAAGFNRAVLSNRALVWIGLISYPLYLWHWPMLSFARILGGGTPPAATRAFLLGASFVAASVTYILIERPIRTSPRRRVAVGMLCAGAVVVGLLGLATFHLNGFARRFEGRSAAFAADVQLDRWGPDRSRQIECPPGLFEGDTKSTACLQSSRSQPTMVIWGDSHAQHLFPGLSTMDSRTWLLIGRNLCPPTLGLEVVVKIRGCRQHNEEALRFIQRTPAIDTVVLAFLSEYPSGTIAIPDRLASHDVAASISSMEFTGANKEALFFLGLDKTVTVLEGLGKKVIVFVDNPALPSPPRDCLRAEFTPIASRHDCSVLKVTALERQKVYRSVLQRVVAAHPRVRLFDSFDILCGRERCEYRNADMLFYRDPNHLSLRGSAWMAKGFLGWMSKPHLSPEPGAPTERKAPAPPSRGGRGCT